MEIRHVGKTVGKSQVERATLRIGERDRERPVGVQS